MADVMALVEVYVSPHTITGLAAEFQLPKVNMFVRSVRLKTGIQEIQEIQQICEILVLDT